MELALQLNPLWWQSCH